MNNIRLESGKEYTLKELFSGKNKIIIPDLQRDYCWGDKAWDKNKNSQTELVTNFVENLIETFQSNKKNNKNDILTLGLIYGYEQPTYHIQLCDGQQRITTLFLLLGMINRQTDNHFQKYLISDFELNEDDREPYLQYAIRESTLYFLSDLVCEFFLKGDTLISEIKKQEWFFTEYDLDASIVSMIEALQLIEKKITETEGLNLNEFGDFIVNNLQMLYYDMGNRTRGEETFVIINTTGEPLTATENLKPILLESLDNTQKSYPNNVGDENIETGLEYYSRQWEDREDWFWKNRTETSKTADGGLKDFFIWYWQIRLLQEKTWKGKTPFEHNPKELFTKKPEEKGDGEENPNIEKWEDSKNLDTVQKYFLALKILVEICKHDENVAKVLKTIENKTIDLSWFRKSELHVVLPFIAYLEKFPNAEFFYEFARRIRKNHFDKKRVRGNFIDWRYIIQIIEFSETEKEVLTFEIKETEDKFRKIPNVTLNEWYNDDERNKDSLKENHKLEIEKWEDNEDLMGDLSPFWRANAEREVTYENLKQIWNTFSTIYNCYDENWSKDNPVLSNYVRLYRLFIENSRIGHVSYTSGMLGAWFSWHDRNDNAYFEYLKSECFISLLQNDSTSLLFQLKKHIQEMFEISKFDMNDSNFSPKNHLKAWLLLKAIKAEKHHTLLSFYDGRGRGNGLATWNDPTSNKINKSLPFSLGNSICGYAVKSPANYIEYASSDEWWANPMVLDTIICNSISLEEFQNKDKNDIALEKIQAIDDEINSLIKEFYS